jgi:hypothetical protein
LQQAGGVIGVGHLPAIGFNAAGHTTGKVIEWGEVLEDRGIRHPGDMEKKASREAAKNEALLSRRARTA